jgi:hypothetical protein
MTMTVDTNTPPKDLIGFLDYYLVQKAPFQIPDGGREIIVKFGPWITVVLLVLMLPPLLLVLGIGTVLMPFGGIGYATGFGLSAIGLVATIALMVMALPGLFARKMAGWTMMFYAEIASIVTSLVTGSIFAAIFGGLIGLYVLFQVRGLYR